MSGIGNNGSLSNRDCAVCGASNQEVFFRQPQMPVFCNILWSSSEAAITCPRGDIVLAFCHKCGFIGNIAFEASRLEYSAEYENSLHYSPRFREYAESLAHRLIDNYDLYGKYIIEIGCGKGDFLMMLCRLGKNRGIGFDRSYVPEPEHKHAGSDITFVQDFYSPKYANHQADLICCRHVLEHFDQPTDYLREIGSIIKDTNRTALFFEVPNSLQTFRKMAIWDIIYEHPSYFTPVSLRATFRHAGFTVKRTSEEFEGQFLTIDAIRAKDDIPSREPEIDDLQSLRNDVVSFTEKFNLKREEWMTTLDKQFSSSRRVVVWGSGSKGVTFLNMLADKNQIQYAVDINPRKQGKFIAGTGQQVVAPEFMAEYQPEAVFIANPIYEEEIRRLSSEFGINPEFLVV